MTGRIAFIGAGRWALALAQQLNREGASVSLWEKMPDRLERLLETRRHPDLPESLVLPAEMVISDNLADVLSQAGLVFFACPSGNLAEAARLARDLIPADTEAIITVSKGIDPSTLRRMSVLLRELVPRWTVVVLAGPAIPFDFALGDPTSLVAASDDEKAVRMVRDRLTAGNLRVYSSSDVVGVELGAALKNVVALATGIADGLGLGINAKAALLTRGLAEITRLGVAMNANPLTFSGLSGIGDLILTAFSDRSRNHTLGFELGKGKTPAEAQSELHGIAEGMTTVGSARELSLRHHVEMPIVEEVHLIIHNQAPPWASLERLMRRSPKKERIP